MKLEYLSRLPLIRRMFWLAILILPVLSCRTINVVQSFTADSQLENASARATLTPTIPSTLPIAITGATLSPEPVAMAAGIATPTPQSDLVFVAPTQNAIPTIGVRPTTRAPIVRAPIKTSTPTRIPATPAPSFAFHVDFSWCGPNWLTFVEGTVSQDGIPRDGLRVRVSLGPDGLPAWNDYVTGTDSTKPGGYTQIIDANSPHEGVWYLWLVDPQTSQRISDIAVVKTDAKRQNETSCQSATVNFSSP